MIGYQNDIEKFFIFLFTLVVLSMTATSMCFLISSLAPSIAVGNFVAVSNYTYDTSVISVIVADIIIVLFPALWRVLSEPS